MVQHGNHACSNNDATCRSPWPLQTFYREIQEQARTALPAMVTMFLTKIPWLISLSFVGRIGAQELAAAALATTFCNVTGMSLSVGQTSAITTLTGSARGNLKARRSSTKHETEKDEEISSLITNRTKTEPYHSIASFPVCSSGELDCLTPLMYLYRGVFIQLILVIPVGIWWLYGIKPVLVALGQGQVLAEMTEPYLQVLTPGMWSYSINWTVSTWLQAIEMADVPVYAAFIGLVVHVPLNLLFIHVLGWGYLGVGAATVLFQLVQPLVIFWYLFGTNHGSTRILKSTFAENIGCTKLTFWKEAKLAVGSPSGIFQYFSLALPGIVIISEWWASEIAIFLAGTLTPSPDIALAGMAIYQSINTSCFMIPVGVSIAGSTRVSNFLGAGDANSAKFSAQVSVFSAGVLSTMMGLIIFFTPHSFFPSIISLDADVVFETSRTIPLLAMYVFADGIQVALNGVIKGCGRQFHILPIVVVAYWVVALPLAYYITFTRNGGYMCNDSYFCGIVGLVAGMTTGTFVHVLLLGCLVAVTTDWEAEVKKAQARLSL